jgi:hypothetical protein
MTYFILFYFISPAWPCSGSFLQEQGDGDGLAFRAGLTALVDISSGFLFFSLTMSR